MILNAAVVHFLAFTLLAEDFIKLSKKEGS